MTHPVGRVVVVVVAIALLGAGVVLWFGRIGLRELAAANLATAPAGGFSRRGTALLVATAAALVVLAAVEAATLRR